MYYLLIYLMLSPVYCTSVNNLFVIFNVRKQGIYNDTINKTYEHKSVYNHFKKCIKQEQKNIFLHVYVSKHISLIKEWNHFCNIICFNLTNDCFLYFFQFENTPLGNSRPCPMTSNLLLLTTAGSYPVMEIRLFHMWRIFRLAYGTSVVLLWFPLEPEIIWCPPNNHNCAGVTSVPTENSRNKTSEV